MAKMVSGSARWRRALLCTIAGATALLWAFAGSASATSDFDSTTATTTTLDSDVHYWTPTRPVTSGAYQYWAYWDAADRTGTVYLALVRRKISDGTTSTLVTNHSLSVPTDGHNSISMGVSPNDGVIHLSYSAHALPHVYGYSSTGCLSQATFSNCTFTWTDHQANSTTEAKLTYPVYLNDSAGHLYFFYRYGINDNGDEYLNKYDDSTHTWSEVGKIFAGRSGNGSWDLDGAGPWPATTFRGIYFVGAQFDKNDRLHVVYNWRETDPTGVSPKLDDTVRNHDIDYVYSDDFGRTWYNNAGTKVADMSTSDSVVVNDTGTQVITYPWGYALLSPNQLLIDSNGQPHGVVAASDTQADEPMNMHIRHLHVWRTTSGTWYSSFVDPATPVHQNIVWGEMMFDQADDLYMIAGRNDIGWDAENPSGYNLNLPSSNFTWQGGDHLDIRPASSITGMTTTDQPGTTIATGSATDNRNIEIKIRNNTNSTSFAFNFITTAQRNWSNWVSTEGKTFTVANDNTYHTVVVPMSAVTSWSGTLKAMEFTAAGTSGDMSIDYIHIQNDSGTVAKAWDFNAGQTVTVSASGQGDNWTAWTIDDLLPGVNDTLADSNFEPDIRRYAIDKKVDFSTIEQGAPGTESLVLHEFDILGDDMIRNYNFAVDDMRWTANGNVSGFGWASDGGAGSIAGTITGNDSQLFSPDHLGTPITANTLRVRIKNGTSATTGRVSFITDADGTYDTTKSKTFTMTARSGYAFKDIDMSTVRGWTGTLRQIRVDPSDDAGVTSGTFDIDRVQIY